MDLERKYVVAMKGCKFLSQQVRFRNSGDSFLIHYSMMNNFKDLNSAYHTHLLYNIRTMSVNRMLSRYVIKEV